MNGGNAARQRVVNWLEQGWKTRDPLLTDSGTTALTLALLASQDDRRRGVALPAYGCYDLVTAALGADVPVHWYDLDPATLGPDWASLEAALKAGASGVVVAHFYGVPVDLGALRDLAGRYGALIIEDAAQGIGGSLNDQPLGALGDLGVLSFGRGKGLTGGGGGALLLNSEPGREAFLRVAHRLEVGGGGLRTIVTTTAQWLLARPSAYAIPSSLPFLRLGETLFREPEPLREISPAQLGILASLTARVIPEAQARKRNAAWFAERMGAQGRIPDGGVGRAGYLRLPLMVGSRLRAQVEGSTARAMGVMPGYPKVLNTLTASTSSSEHFKGASELVKALITLPVHSRLSNHDRMKIYRWMTGQ
jgi:dTDP-4-amino-4,6-dideoxygalactose transaminase